jgi:hypothetical protein
MNISIGTALSGFTPGRRNSPLRLRPCRFRSLVWTILCLAPAGLHASAPGNNFAGYAATTSVVTNVAHHPGGGFWVQLEDTSSLYPDVTGTYSQYGAPRYDSVKKAGAIVAVPGTRGYWIVTLEGEILYRGPVPAPPCARLSDCTGLAAKPGAGQEIVAAAATPTGKGLWALGRDGRVWTVGDARSYGDVTKDAAISTGIVPTPSGNGYYIVKADGGVFAFGDAVFYGSTGGKEPGGKDVTGIALSIDQEGKVNGYWITATDGAVYTFGQAPFWGNAGVNPSVVTNIISFPVPVSGQTPSQTQGYALVHDNGNVGVHYRP